MLQEDLVAERIAIDSYREIIDYLGSDDPTSRRVMEEILAKEEEHAEDLGTLLEELGKKGEPAKEPLRERNRSEEHTSELQSLMRISYAVFCLKKKKTKRDNHKITTKQ